jgi:ATP-binding cassette, subfamily B, multidrug efflux pump
MNQLKHVIPYLERHLWRIGIGFFAIMAGTACSVFQPYVLAQAIDSLQHHPSLSQLNKYVLVYLLAAVGVSVFSFIQRSTVNRVSRFLEYDLRNDAFTHLQSLDQEFYGQMHTGDLMARLTNDLNQVRQFVGMGMISLISTFVMLVTVATLMVIINWELALISFLVLPFCSISMYVIGRSLRLRFRGVQDQYGVVSNQAQENLSGIRVVKAFVQEDLEIEAFARVNEEYRRRSLGYQRISGIMWPLMSTVVGIALALVLFIGGTEVANGQINFGEFVQFTVYLGMLTWPMISLGWVINMYQQGAASMGRIMEVMTRQPTIRDTGRTLPIDTITGKIEFRNVGVHYGDTSVLRNISFTVESGETVAIVGTTGSGKSTLMSLVPRVLEADEGEVLIDGVDVRRIPLNVLRRSVGYVPQDTFLFSATLRENVGFGVREPREEDLIDAIEVSRLAKDLEQFPHGLDTIVGERGVSLSGGQKQRTSLARAIMRDPTILILDDAMSSVDTNTQNEILSGLRRVMEHRTTLITSMRISTIKDADRIVLLEDGEIREQGTHRELVMKNGIYARMYRRELLQQEMEVDEEVVP